MYEGDAYQIACELDVTLQVVKDYRMILVQRSRQSSLLDG